MHEVTARLVNAIHDSVEQHGHELVRIGVFDTRDAVLLVKRTGIARWSVCHEWLPNHFVLV